MRNERIDPQELAATMTVVLLIAAVWTIGLAIVVCICLAARRGDAAELRRIASAPVPTAPVSRAPGRIAARRPTSGVLAGSVGARDLVA